MVSHCLAMFGGDKHSGSGDTMVLVCHVISEDVMIKGSFDFMGRKPHCKSPPSKSILLYLDLKRKMSINLFIRGKLKVTFVIYVDFEAIIKQLKRPDRDN